MPTCNTLTSHSLCHQHADVCHFCFPPGQCYEKALWECPREPRCFRNFPEHLAIDPVAPNIMLLLVVSLIIFTMFGFFWWWWRPSSPLDLDGVDDDYDNEPQRIDASLTVSLLSSSTVNTNVVDDETLENLSSDVAASTTAGEPLLIVIPPTTIITPTIDSDHLPTDQQQDEKRRKSVFKFVVTCCCTPLILVSCIVLLLSVPTPPTFDVCDTRWDITTLHKFETKGDDGETNFGLRIKAEIHVSVFNPNRFDIDLSKADGVLTFHKGAIATFSWASTGSDLTPLPAGTVFDARVIITVEKLNVLTVEQLVEDLIKPSGIVLQLNANFFVSLKIGPIPLTPKLAISDPGILLILNQADDTYCKCRQETL
jgi:hypothetical protein